MKDTFLYVLFISAIVALFAFAFSFSKDQDLDVKQIFIESKCNNCHTITSNQITSKKNDALDLSNTDSVGDTQLINSYLLNEAKIYDKDHKVKFNGSEAELKMLSEWLASLKAKSEK